jgi:hypothetical protein
MKALKLSYTVRGMVLCIGKIVNKLTSKRVTALYTPSTRLLVNSLEEW